MTPDLPAVSVIIPTYNRSAVVERTLRHLVELDYPDDRYEILVLDNSSDATPEMVRRVARRRGPQITLIADTPAFPAVKRNMGVAKAGGEICWFINDDMWFRPEALAEHVATHLQSPEPAAVLGHCFQSPEMEPLPFIEFYQPFAYELLEDLADQPVPYQFFWSMNISLPRAPMVEQNLLFHEDWAHIGHEDIELGWRWAGAGHPIVYNPRASGEHYHPHTVASAARLQRTIGAGLRDLESLVADPELLDRYGVATPGSPVHRRARSRVRDLVITSGTAPRLVAWLDARPQRSRLADLLYWKVLMYHLNRGYREAPERRPTPLATVGGR